MTGLAHARGRLERNAW